ncbi:MAG: hypothetical protein EAY75_18155 [Bacteroidetes bacterium]|nr:MAG: hypothetical protein EAY75_18155 [Bacteroidota bacterium]
MASAKNPPEKSSVFLPAQSKHYQTQLSLAGILPTNSTTTIISAHGYAAAWCLIVPNSTQHRLCLPNPPYCNRHLVFLAHRLFARPPF